MEHTSNEVKDVKNYRKMSEVQISEGNGIKPWMKTATFNWVYNTIISDVKKKAVEEIRNEPDRGKRNILKQEKLGYFNIGLFKENYRSDKNLISTEFMLFDFDHMGGDINEHKNKLKDNPAVYAVFISPSGDGLKVIFRLDKPITDPTFFSRLYKHYALEFGAALGKTADKTSDVSRPCFFSFDQKMYINEYAIPLSVDLDSTYNRPLLNKGRPTREESLQSLQGAVEGSRHNSLVSNIGLLLSKNFDKEFIQEFAESWNLRNTPPLQPSEVLETIENVCDSYMRSDELEGYYSQGKEIYEIGFVKDKFFIEKIGKDKFNIKILDRFIKKQRLGEVIHDLDQAVKDGYFRLVVEKHIKHLARVDYITDPDITNNEYQVLLDEGAIQVKFSMLPVNVKDNNFVEAYLDKTFGQYKVFIKNYLAAYCYTNYQKLPTMIFYGERGSGKSTFAELLLGICPQVSTQWSGNEEAFSYEGEKKLLLVEENNTDKTSQYKTLKKYTGQKYSTVHKKFKDPYMVMNNMNIVICSNEPIPMYVKKEELPTDEANNQFFVFEFKKFESALDNMIQQKLLDRLGHYIRTELRAVYNSLVTANFRYSISVPITKEETDLFNSNTTELDFDTELVIQDLSRKMNSTSAFRYRGFIQEKLLPVAYISQWNADITRTHRNSIIKQLKRRRLISADPAVKKQIGGYRESSYIMTDDFLNLITS
jgi:energy-coupling factor transporter ATP-binding protein EcfA2